MEERRPIPYADSAEIAAALMDHLEKLDALKGRHSAQRSGQGAVRRASDAARLREDGGIHGREL